MGELVPIVGEGIVSEAAQFYESNQDWLNPAMGALWDQVKDFSLSRAEMKYLQNKSWQRVEDKIGWLMKRTSNKRSSGRKNPRRQISNGMPAIASLTNTIKCIDLGKCYVKGRKPAKISKTVANWKVYRNSYQDLMQSTPGSVLYHFICSTWDNDTNTTKNTLNTGRYCGFNGVDKLVRIDGSAAANTIAIFAPTYSGVTGVRSVMTDPENIRALVALRRQVIQMNWQNTNSTTTAEISVYLLELKKDMLEYRAESTNMNVPEDYFGFGFIQKYDVGDSVGEPPAGNEQRSWVNLNDNPMFKEYFKVVDKTRVCLQPGQSCRKSYIMNGNQILSYAHLAKNVSAYNADTDEPLWYHVAHKKGEKIFMFKVHGTMEPIVGPPAPGTPAYPGYTQANVVAWYETSFEATKLDYNSSRDIIWADPNF